MLLYVDKKKQRRQKIKIITIILIWCFVLCANVVLYRLIIYQADKNLTEDVFLQNREDVVLEHDSVCLFSAKGKISSQIVVVPDKLNQYNMLTLGYVFSKLSSDVNNVFFSPEVEEQEYLLRLLKVYVPNVVLSNTMDGIIITTNYEKFAGIVQKNRLFPKVFSYSNAVRKQKTVGLKTLLDERFPLPVLPTTHLEKEKALLLEFVKKYQGDLRGLLSGKDELIFSARHYFLQHANLCVVAESNVLCALATDKALQKNMRDLLKKASLRGESVRKIMILTSLQEVDWGDDVQSDDGLVFRYGEREAIILPDEKIKYEDIYSALQLNAGINPNYHVEDMKYYKFKAVEVYADDEV